MGDQPGAERILLVTEEESGARIQEFLEGLEGSEFSVSYSGNSKDALARMAEEKTDLVVVDIGVVGGSTDFVREALEADPDIAIIALSDMSDATSAAICLQHGAYDYLTKPLRLEDLRLSIDRCGVCAIANNSASRWP